MRVSHFAKLEVIVPKDGYTPDESDTIGASIKTVGMAQTVRIDDRFGSRPENTIGTPLPILVPGYQETSITIEKATIDGADFRNLGAFNPLWAHIGSVYSNKIPTIPGSLGDAANNGMFPFFFIVRLRNKISAEQSLTSSTTYSNITKENLPAGNVTDNTTRLNTFGTYACVLQSASVNATSSNAVIIDNITSIARPISGTWLNDIIKKSFNDQNTQYSNGMSQVIYNVLYGYES